MIRRLCPQATSYCRWIATRSLSNFVSRYRPTDDRRKSNLRQTDLKLRNPPKTFRSTSELRYKPNSFPIGSSENDHLFDLIRSEPMSVVDTSNSVLQKLSQVMLNDDQVSQNKFKPILDQLVIELPKFTESDLFSFLSIVSSIKNEQNRHLLNPLSILMDIAMANWLSSVDLDTDETLTKAFQVMDIFYLNKFKLKGSFIKFLRDSLLNKLDSLDTDSLKKLLFIINLYRMPLTESEHKSLEVRVLKVIQELTLEETSLVACAFFKTESKILNEGIILEILNKLKRSLLNDENSMNRKSPVDSIAYASIFKALKYSFTERNASEIRQVIKSLDEKVVGSFPLQTLVHLNNLASQYLEPNQAISRMLIQKCVEDEHARLKDITHALRIAYDFHVDISDTTIDIFIHRIGSNPVVYMNSKFLFHFLGFLNLIASFSRFPDHLIHAAIQLKSRNTWSGFERMRDQLMDMNHHWLQLHTLVKLYQPNLGPILTESEVYEMASKILYMDPSRVNVKNTTSFGYSFNRLFQGVGYVFSPSRVAVNRVLPESAFPEIIVTTSDSMRRLIHSNSNKYILEPNAFDGCLLINLKHRSHFSDVNDTILRGYYRTRLKLFQKMGFSVLDIHWMQVAGEGKQFIGLFVRRTLRERIDKGEIDPRFSVLCDDT